MQFKIYEPKDKVMTTHVSLIDIDKEFEEKTYLKFENGMPIKYNLNKTYVIQIPFFYNYRLKLAKKKLIRRYNKFLRNKNITDRTYYEKYIA